MNEVVDTLGKEGLQTLWADLQQVLQDSQQLAQLPEGLQVLFDDTSHACSCALAAWVECWARACREHAQRVATQARLQQLFHHPCRHPQQQRGGRRSKRPRLARELAMLLEQQEQPAPAMASSAAAGINSDRSRRSSRRAQLAGIRQQVAARQRLQAGAASGDEKKVRAAIEELPDRPSELYVAAVAAGRESQWGLCMRLLRELVVLDVAKARVAVQLIHDQLTRQMPDPEEEFVPPPVVGFKQQLQVADAYWQFRARVHDKKRVRAALQLCDTLLEDWLVVRQLPVPGLEEAVVTAVESATAAACL